MGRLGKDDGMRHELHPLLSSSNFLFSPKHARQISEQPKRNRPPNCKATFSSLVVTRNCQTKWFANTRANVQLELYRRFFPEISTVQKTTAHTVWKSEKFNLCSLFIIWKSLKIAKIEEGLHKRHLTNYFPEVLFLLSKPTLWELQEN